MAEAVGGIAFVIGVVTEVLEGVEEEGESPFRIGVALDAHEPFGGDAEGEGTFDVLPGGDVAVVHEEEGVVGERVAICFGEVSFGGGADVGED